jgi:hypothetical protein
MSKKATLSLFILLSLPFLLFYSCEKSGPTTPELPKQRASVKVEVAKWPIDINWWDWDNGYILLNPEVLVSESNGVGGRVSKAQATVYIGDKFKAQDTEEGGRFVAFGSLKIFFSLKIYLPDYKVDKLIITIEGGDDNGYSFNKSVSYTLSW